MRELPYDFSRCLPKQCEDKEKCARFTSRGNPDGWQAMADFSLPHGRACSDFVANGAPTHLPAPQTSGKEGEAK